MLAETRAGASMSRGIVGPQQQQEYQCAVCGRRSWHPPGAPPQSCDTCGGVLVLIGRFVDARLAANIAPRAGGLPSNALHAINPELPYQLLGYGKDSFPDQPFRAIEPEMLLSY